MQNTIFLSNLTKRCKEKNFMIRVLFICHGNTLPAGENLENTGGLAYLQ